MPTGLETLARTKRFRAMGCALRDLGVKALLLGQHQDDNVETVFKRFSETIPPRPTALTGIWQCASIPECHGIYGLSESGSSFSLRGHNELASSSPRVHLNTHLRVIRWEGPKRIFRENEIATELSPPKEEPWIATGGISVCRPMLSFTKAQLLATCEENNVPFVTDPTNFDLKLTKRNTIRSLLASNQLPRALQAPSILSLINSSRELINRRAFHSNKLLENCKILDFNLNTGLMVVKLPSPDSKYLHPDPNPSTDVSSPYDTRKAPASPVCRSQEIESFTLRRITDLVSPRLSNTTGLTSFDHLTERIFFPPPPPPTPVHSGLLPQMTSSWHNRSLTVNGVLFMPLNWEKRTKEKKLRSTSPDFVGLPEGGIPKPAIASGAHSQPDDHPEYENVWLVTRQPFMAHPHPSQPLPFTISIPPSDNPTVQYSVWDLWDNRFWFRMSITPVPSPSLTMEDLIHELEGNKQINHSQISTPKITVKVKPFQPEDLRRVRNMFLYRRGKHLEDLKRRSHAHHFNRQLKRTAPGFTVYTLPVVMLENNGEEIPIGLPTAGGRFSHEVYDFECNSRRWRIGWEWLYKKIDVEALQLMGWVDKD